MKTSKKKLTELKAYLTEQYETGDSGWLEGWICGYSDLDHTKDKGLRDTLFNHLSELRKGKTK